MSENYNQEIIRYSWDALMELLPSKLAERANSVVRAIGMASPTGPAGTGMCLLKGTTVTDIINDVVMVIMSGPDDFVVEGYELPADLDDEHTLVHVSMRFDRPEDVDPF